jgi:mannose-6-phosphate isomerase-like protein (cupin superfamily)
MAHKVNLERIARDATVPFSPIPVAEIDDYHAFVVLFEGTFPWHDHGRDEFFLVLDGELRIEFKGGLAATTLAPMDTLRVAAGTVHQTVAPRRCRVLVFERQSVTQETFKDR